MHNINIIHRSFFPTAMRCFTGCISFSLPYLSLPCLYPCPAYFLDLPMPTSFCLCLLPLPISSASACLLALPNSVPCLFICPAYFLALPFCFPCLLPCPTYRPTFFYECTLHGYIASDFNDFTNIY